MRPVSLSRIEPYISQNELNLIREIYPDNIVPVWGVTLGKNNVNKNKWNKVQKGDVTLFTGNKKIFASGVVTYKFQSKELALELWGWEKPDSTWENIYLLDEIQHHHIPVKDLNRVVGYAENNAIMGFTVLDEDKSEMILNSFGLLSETYFPDVSIEEYKEALKSFDTSKPLDSYSIKSSRTEQSFLRKHLFKNKKTCKCGICGNVMPVKFLVAAHIKKRSFCSDEEKLDFDSIVLPMCKFGCDELYREA